MKNSLKKIPALKYLVITIRTFAIHFDIIKKTKLLISFFRDYRNFKKLAHNENYILETADLFPRIYDKTDLHKLDPIYFLQGTWCARKIFEEQPKEHYDIGSQALMVGIISQFVPTTMVDIRPMTIVLPGLSFIKGDITALPFLDRSISSLSSICVIEHIGLGRYGDPLDQYGAEKAAKELVRVLADGGSLYVSVPVDVKNKVYFNAHRAFTRDYIVSLFKPLSLIEERYIYGKDIQENYDTMKGFGTGLYHLKNL